MFTGMKMTFSEFHKTVPGVTTLLSIFLLRTLELWILSLVILAPLLLSLCQCICQNPKSKLPTSQLYSPIFFYFGWVLAQLSLFQGKSARTSFPRQHNGLLHSTFLSCIFVHYLCDYLFNTYFSSLDRSARQELCARVVPELRTL